jgi:hypothetical protein
VQQLSRWAQVRSWLSTAFGRRGSARVIDLSNGSQEDGSVASGDGDVLPTVRQAKIAMPSAARPAIAATSAAAASADAGGTVGKPAAGASENREQDCEQGL